MRKLSEYRDEEALDLLADILDPITEIMSDQEIKNAYGKKITKIALASLIIKRHKKSVMKLLAILEGVPIEQYHCNLITLPKAVLEIINDKDLMAFFGSQSQEMEEESFGSVTESGEEEA